MAQLTKVLRSSDGEVLIVDTDTAQSMKDAGTITIPAATEGVLTLADVFGADYEPETGIGEF